MHIVEIKEPLQWSHAMEPGKYYVEDHNAAEMLWAGRGLGKVKITSDAHLPLPSVPATPPPGSDILVVRVGGFGDLLWLNPIYRHLRNQGVHISHCCFPRYRPVLNGFIDEFVPYPLAVDDAEGFDRIYWLENIVEGSPCDTEHPAKRFQAEFGLSDLPLSAFDITPFEKEFAVQAWPRKSGKKRVCVQMGSSGVTKDYLHMERLLPLLFESGFEILVVGDPRQDKEPVPENVFDCTQKGFGIGKSIAMASCCDLIIAPDSVFVHIAGALGIPCVSLFGPFAGAAYTQGYPGYAFQGRGKCSPCHWHPRGTPFPPGYLCSAKGHCVALANIPPEDVMFQVKMLLK